jgi:hypothetical protein
MADLSNISGLVNSATSTVSSVASSITTGVTNLVGTGPASLLTSVEDGISGLLGAAGNLFKTLSGVSLPLKNPLFGYASYDYLLSISVLTDDQVNFPDKSYMAGLPTAMICGSANINPTNRIQTPYGQFDFFIDNLDIKSNIGLEKAQTTNVTNLSFDVIEPYSFGMFMISVQQAAYQSGHRNWQDAPFLLTIQFRGNTETGIMSSIPNTTRYIPFRFSTMSTRVTAAGSVHSVVASAWQNKAQADVHSKMKGDSSVSGKTVQEVLQTGEKSLQKVENDFEQKINELKLEIEILKTKP